MIRILIVDDHPVVREGLRALLETEAGLEVVGLAAGGNEALGLFERLHPDVTLLDLHLARENGLDVLREIRRLFPGAGIVVISAYDHIEDIICALQFGAGSFVPKDSSGDDLVAAIRVVHAGGRLIPPQIGDPLACRKGGGVIDDREQTVLQLLADGRSHREIASRPGIPEGTVGLHVRRIFEQLGVDDRPQAFLAALRQGLIHF